MIYQKSRASNFLLNIVILFLISFQNILETSQHSLKALSVNGSNSASVDCLHTCLSVDIMDQGQLSKVLSIFVLVNHSWELIISLLLFSDKISLQNNVKLVPTFALLNYVLSILKFFLLQNIIKLLS